jgi:hypothetical protein
MSSYIRDLMFNFVFCFGFFVLFWPQVFSPASHPSKHTVVQHLKTLLAPPHAQLPSFVNVLYSFHGTSLANIKHIISGAFHALFRNDGIYMFVN